MDLMIESLPRLLNATKLTIELTLLLLVLKIAKKTPTNIPKKSDKNVNSIVNFAAFNKRGKCSTAKSKSI